LRYIILKFTIGYEMPLKKCAGHINKAN